MTREEAKQSYLIMKAYAEGKIIQFYDTVGKRWEDLGGHVEFDHPPHLFRIKPEPRVVWINEYTDGFGNWHYSSVEEATEQGEESKKYLRTIKFVEVVE